MSVITKLMLLVWAWPASHQSAITLGSKVASNYYQWKQGLIHDHPGAVPVYTFVAAD